MQQKDVQQKDALVLERRGGGVGAAALLWLWTSETMLLIIALASVYRLFTKDAPETPDQAVLFQFVGLLVALSGVYYFTT